MSVRKLKKSDQIHRLNALEAIREKVTRNPSARLEAKQALDLCNSIHEKMKQQGANLSRMRQAVRELNRAVDVRNFTIEKLQYQNTQLTQTIQDLEYKLEDSKADLNEFINIAMRSHNGADVWSSSNTKQRGNMGHRWVAAILVGALSLILLLVYLQ